MNPLWETQGFTREEFACKCGCGWDTVDYGLICTLQAIRAELYELYDFHRIRIHIDSGCRCEKYNAHVGGSSKSQHLYGRAADIRAEEETAGGWVIIPSSVVADIAENLNVGGVGRYETFTHIDSRNSSARWGN